MSRREVALRDGVVLGSPLGEYVVFDLEANADRSDPPAHEIIEIGAVVVRGDSGDRKEIASFETLVRPTRPLRDFTRELTGLTDNELADAPPPAQALQDFYSFVGNRPMIAHNGLRYDFLLLDAAAEDANLPIPDNVRLDSLELAHMVFPRAGKGIVANIDGTRPPRARSLDELAQYFFGEEPRDQHRAIGDARLLHRVLLDLLSIIDRDDPVRGLQRWVLSAGRHPWARFLNAAPIATPLKNVVRAPDPVRRDPPSGAFDPEAVVGMFSEGGGLMRKARKPRPQQTEMAQHIARALHRGDRHLIEAPTGTGKTLAYLVPAIEFARATGETVIVAPHSKVLQDQVLSSLEELKEDLDPFNSVLLKGRNNYISLESLAAELDALAESPGAHTSADVFALAMICGWIAQTVTGDWGDLRAGALESGRTALGKYRFLLRVEDPPGPPQTPLDGIDFYRRARDGLRHAHVAVLNHSLIVTDHEWLDHARRLVLDEAHNLEDAATGALSAAISRDDLFTMCDALWDPQHRRGTVQRLASAAKWPLREEPLNRIRETVEDVRLATRRFGPLLVEYLRVRTGASSGDAYPVSYRIRPGIDTRRPEYSEVLRTGNNLVEALHSVADALNEVNLPGELLGRYQRHRLENEIQRLGRRIREAARTANSVIKARDHEQQIAIGEIGFTAGDWAWELKRSPVSVASHLRNLWERLKTVVLASATLRVNGAFDYAIDSLGLEQAQLLTLDSPFASAADNHLLLRTDYLPAPRARLMEEFTASAAKEVPRLLILTGGRGLVLMTARARMEYVRNHSRPILDAVGIPLLTQGDDSPGALVERMREEQATSLVALRSFWEGVDIPGDALSLLIIEKIPFDSPADPVVDARMAALERRGKDPFADYLVPRAALRFAQGVGRLIRTESDRGVTVVLDSRLCRAVPYRDAILGTLPGPPRMLRANQPEQAYRHIADHLGDINLSDELRQQMQSDDSSDPWAGLADLELAEADIRQPEIIAERLDQVRTSFGFKEWRPGQLETMERFMQGDDVLAVLPTGTGKSITFQVPALLSPGVTLVISPLVALMNDQTENLRARGITKAAAIHSGVGLAEARDVMRGAERGDYKLLYVSPERLWSQEFVKTLRQIGVARIAVDEAHCISQWGHSFRPEYAAIPQALARLGETRRLPILAVTATADQKVRDDIRESLKLNLTDDPLVLSPDRPEIDYYVEHCENLGDRDLRVVQVVDAYRREAAIVYVPTRKDTTRIAGLLAAAGHNARPYHGAVEKTARQHTEDAFRHGEVDVVVATKAFGMGIDKPNITLVVHLEMPATIEEYVQETGRAARGAIEGKGPKVGAAVLMETPRDCSIHRLVIKSAAPDSEAVRRVWARTKVGVHAYDPAMFGRDDTTDHGGQDAALAVHYLQQAAGLRRDLDTPWQGRVSIMDDTERLLDEIAESDPALAASGRTIVEFQRRGGNDEYHAKRWAKRLSRTPMEIAADLFELTRRDVLGFSAWKHAWVIERAADAQPNWAFVEDQASRRRKTVADKARQAKKYARQSDGCRRRMLLDYFDSGTGGWRADEGCGRCDVCAPLERRWDKSPITRKALLESIPKRPIVLQLLYDTEGLRYSRSNVVNALAGRQSAGYLPRMLANHPTFGRLSFLGEQEVQGLVDDLIDNGDVDSSSGEYNKTTYEILQITPKGRAAL